MKMPPGRYAQALLLLCLASRWDLHGLCTNTGEAAARRILTHEDAWRGPRSKSSRKISSRSKLESSSNNAPLPADGNCSALGDSVFVDSSIEHIAGCYLNTNRRSSYGSPVFVKYGIPIMRGSSVLFTAHAGSGDTSPEAPAEFDDLYTWSIWRLDNSSEGGWSSRGTTCSVPITEVGMDPTDSRLSGEWECSYEEDGLITILPADFDGVRCRLGCNNPRAFAAGGDDDDDSDDDFDRKVGTLLYAIFVIAAIFLLTVGIVWFCRRAAPSSG